MKYNDKNCFNGRKIMLLNNKKAKESTFVEERKLVTRKKE
jgi:hypothetical protein